MAPEVCMVRKTTVTKIDLFAKRVKDPFLWFHLVDFTIIYGIHNQGYFHLVVSTIDGIFFFGRHVPMCRFSDVTCLEWSNVRFDPGLHFLKLLLKEEKILNSVNGTRLQLQLLMH